MSAVSASTKFILSIFGLVLGVSPVTGGEVAQPQAPAQPSVRLTALTVARSVRFGASLKDAQSETMMGMGLALDAGDKDLRAITGLTFEEIVTTSGEQLTIQPEYQAFLDRQLQRWTHEVIGQDRRGDGRRPQAGPERGARPDQPPRPEGLMLSLTPPTKAMTGLKSVRGAVVISLASGDKQKLPMGPLNKWLDKTVQVEGLPTAFVTVKRVVDGQLQLTLSNDLAPLVEDLYAYAVDGKPLPSRLIGINREAGHGMAVIQCEVPDDGSIDLVYREKVESVTIPFHFVDVPLPGPDFLPVPDAIVTPVDVK